MCVYMPSTLAVACYLLFSFTIPRISAQQVVAAIKAVQKDARAVAENQIDSYCRSQTHDAVVALAPRSLPQEVVAAAAQFARMKAAWTARQMVDKHVRDETEQLFKGVMRDAKRLARPALQQRSFAYLNDLCIDLDLEFLPPSVGLSGCVDAQPADFLQKQQTVLQTVPVLLDCWQRTGFSENGTRRNFIFECLTFPQEHNVKLCAACGALVPTTLGRHTLIQSDSNPFHIAYRASMRSHGCTPCLGMTRPVGDAREIRLPFVHSDKATTVTFERLFLSIPSESASFTRALHVTNALCIQVAKFSVMHGYLSLILRECLCFLLSARVGDMCTWFRDANSLAAFACLLPISLRAHLLPLLTGKLVECYSFGDFSSAFLPVMRGNSLKSFDQKHKAANIVSLLSKSELLRQRFVFVQESCYFIGIS